jgi:catechol 2,3-dioxygenase-like lactoylglutathione lyase family enzyme
MTETGMFTGIDHVAIFAKDPKALARWYRDTFGFEIVTDRKTSDGKSVVFLSLRGDRIEILEADNVPRVPHGRKDPGIRHIAISVTDLHKVYNLLTTRKITFKFEPRKVMSSGVAEWMTVFDDPENNEVQLIQKIG